MAHPILYHTLLNPEPRSWWQRILMSYSPSFGEKVRSANFALKLSEKG